MTKVICENFEVEDFLSLRYIAESADNYITDGVLAISRKILEDAGWDLSGYKIRKSDKCLPVSEFEKGKKWSLPDTSKFFKLDRCWFLYFPYSEEIGFDYHYVKFMFDNFEVDKLKVLPYKSKYTVDKELPEGKVLLFYSAGGILLGILSSALLKYVR